MGLVDGACAVALDEPSSVFRLNGLPAPLGTMTVPSAAMSNCTGGSTVTDASTTSGCGALPGRPRRRWRLAERPVRADELDVDVVEAVVALDPIDVDREATNPR